MARSAESVELDAPTAGAWKEAAAMAIEAWPGAEEWSMRLVCTRGPEDGGPPTAYVLGQDLSRSSDPAARGRRRQSSPWREGCRAA